MAQDAKGGATYPVQSVGLYGWDGDEWIQLLFSGGSLSVNLDQVGGTAQTGDDWTLRFQALNDDTVQGLFRSVGDAGPLPTNTTGETVLHKLERAARSADTVGANTGVIRTLGDAGNVPVDVAGHTMLSWLSQIVTALGTPTLEWAPLSAAANGAAPFNVDIDTGIAGGRPTVCINVANALNASTFIMRGSIDGVTYVDLFTGNVAPGGGQVNSQFFNAYQYLRLSVTVVGGGTTFATLAASR